MHNRYEFTLQTIAEAYLDQKTQPEPQPEPHPRRQPARRPIRSLVVDAARPLHDAWDRLTRQPVPVPIRD